MPRLSQAILDPYLLLEYIFVPSVSYHTCLCIAFTYRINWDHYIIKSVRLENQSSGFYNELSNLLTSKHIICMFQEYKNTFEYEFCTNLIWMLIPSTFRIIRIAISNHLIPISESYLETRIHMASDFPEILYVGNMDFVYQCPVLQI